MQRVEILDSFKANITVEQEFRALALTLASTNGVRVETPMPGSLTIVHRHTPGWAVLLGFLGLFVFLLGMLLWLVKTDDRVALTGRDVEGGSRYTVQGVAVPKLVEFLRAEFPLAA